MGGVKIDAISLAIVGDFVPKAKCITFFTRIISTGNNSPSYFTQQKKTKQNKTFLLKKIEAILGTEVYDPETEA